MLFSLRLLIPYFEQINFKKIGKLFLEMSKLGFWVQLANLAQLMNYRLAYYFIERFAGRQPLGLLSWEQNIRSSLDFPKHKFSSICPLSKQPRQAIFKN